MNKGDRNTCYFSQFKNSYSKVVVHIQTRSLVHFVQQNCPIIKKLCLPNSKRIYILYIKSYVLTLLTDTCTMPIKINSLYKHLHTSLQTCAEVLVQRVNFNSDLILVGSNETQI